MEAIEEHAGVKLAPWVKDAHVAAIPVKARPKRHSKPHDTERDVVELPLRKLIIAGGRADGIEPKDVVHALTAPPASTARQCATSACSSGSPSPRCPNPTLTASCRRQPGSRSADARCGSSWPAA